MKDMFDMGRFLFLVAAIAGVLLALTEQITAPRIAENNRLVFERARQEVLPKASTFKVVEALGTNEAGQPATLSFSLGFAADQTYVGAVQVVSPKGYAGPIDMVVGLHPDLTLSGVKIQSQKETPGLGTKLKEPSFMDPFMNAVKKHGAETQFLVTKDGGHIDAITAATISSRAFCKGVREAIARLRATEKQLEAHTAVPGPGQAPSLPKPAPQPAPAPDSGVSPIPAPAPEAPTPPEPDASAVAPIAPSEGPPPIPADPVPTTLEGGNP
jgi:Na+-translocating ferredoxin:NAD+ oxidoreductase subunit G